MSSTAAFANVFRVPDLRKKIMLTLGLLFIYRIGFHIPLPGVDVRVLQGLADKASGNDILGLMNVLSGGRLNLPVLFSLGILPYITASIIFSLLVKVVPRLEALSKEGPAGQRKINQLTRVATVPLTMVQGIILCTTQFRNLQGPVGASDVQTYMIPAFHDGSLWSTIYVGFMIVAGLTAGTMFVMWLGEQITEFGIGNGASLIIMAGIIASLPQVLGKLVSDAVDDRSQVLVMAVLFIVFIFVVFGVVLITRGQRRIPIQQAKLMRGRKMVGGARHYLPLKVNMANVMPVIFASSLLMFPNLIYNMVAGSHSGLLPAGGWWYSVLFIGLIFFFSFFWTSMMFQPAEMANNLKEYGSFIPGIRPGKKTAEFLERVMVRVTLAGSFFLAIIAILPNLIAASLNVDALTASFLGGTSILIIVGVALDLVDKLNAQLVASNYEGFMGATAAKRGGAA
ncbi:MAG: preprotein translocase subunit SecY [Planctomycetota bacterium]